MNRRRKRIFVTALLYLQYQRYQLRRSWRFWVHPILQARKQHGEYHRLVTELRLDEVMFQQNFRLTRGQFDEVLGKIGDRMSRMDTSYREAIGPPEHLTICLRYLATGDSFHTIALNYRVGVCTVGRIVRDVAAALWDSMVSEVMPTPTMEDWRTIAKDFRHRWNFPNCVGSIDGKHVVIKAPSDSGSLYYNYKRTFSFVLLTVVDAQYRFRVVDIGGYGRTSDGGSLHNSTFGEGLRDGTLDLPQDAVVPGAEHRGSLPQVFVGDEAFPLSRNLMRPFPGSNISREQRVFNYRLSRAMLVVEDAFSILSSKWRMYRRVIGVGSVTAELCVKATCVLHNFLRVTDMREAEPHLHVPEISAAASAAVLQDVARMGLTNATRKAIRVRQSFTSHFCQEGAVPWQENV